MKTVLVAMLVLGLAVSSSMGQGGPMTQSQIQAEIAGETGLQKAQVKAVLDELAQLAYREAKNDFVVAGIGKLVVVDRPARTGRNPMTGEAIQIPAKKAVKFRIAKSCKDAVLGTGN